MNTLPAYIRLLRLDRPVGFYLLGWPTLWALWLAARGFPLWREIAVFMAGVVVMRSAGCVINDFADRDFDRQVARTRGRPLAAGELDARDAVTVFAALAVLALGLALSLNTFALQLSVGGFVLACLYPWMKRHTHLPQVVLGAAFAWAIPMAYATVQNALPREVWLLYCATLLWTVAYDTQYAMVDRDDDVQAGVKSTAILFGDADLQVIALLQLLFLLALALLGRHLALGWPYWLGLVTAAALFGWQGWSTRSRDRDACFRAFLHNHWVGGVIFAGLFFDFLLHAAAA